MIFSKTPSTLYQSLLFLSHRQIVFGHKQSLLEQLRAESEPAMVLHLASTVLFNVFTQCMVHAPGRSVPHIIAHLKTHLAAEKMEVLVSCQGKD